MGVSGSGNPDPLKMQQGLDPVPPNTKTKGIQGESGLYGLVGTLLLGGSVTIGHPFWRGYFIRNAQPKKRVNGTTGLPSLLLAVKAVLRAILNIDERLRVLGFKKGLRFRFMV